MCSPCLMQTILLSDLVIAMTSVDSSAIPTFLIVYNVASGLHGAPDEIVHRFTSSPATPRPTRGSTREMLAGAFKAMPQDVETSAM